MRGLSIRANRHSVEGSVAVVILCRSFAESVGSDHGVFEVVHGLWSASWRKERFASICMAVEDW